MNLYEINVKGANGVNHKSKVYEINVDAAFKEAFIQGKIYGAAKLDDCTIQQIQTNAGVSKDTEREYLGRIKNILDALGPNSYCAMTFEGCVEDAEENIDNDFAVSMKGRWESEKKAHEETREGLISKLNDRIKRVAELEAEVQKARQMEAQARKEAAEDKIALEKAKGKILPDNMPQNLPLCCGSRPTKPPKKHFTTRTGWRQRLKTPSPLVQPTAQSTSASTARPRLMRCVCWVRWKTLEARRMTIDELRILRGLSMEKLCKAADLSMGAVFKLTRPGVELERARFGTVMKLAAGLGAVITVDPEGVTIRPQEEAK